MSEPDPAVVLAQGLLELGTNIEPIFEQAKGLRAKMEAEGWSPTASESAALTWLNGALTMFWSAAVAQAGRQA